jgi:MSHA pilin protein MshD
MAFNQVNITAKGFTLIEMVIGIVALSIAFSLMTSLLLPTTEHSAEQVQQIRASELGQSMLNEILSKSFDHNSDRAGGLQRCGETGFNTCTGTMGPDGIGINKETRASFNDVDDYHGLTIADIVEDSLGNELDLYQGFTVGVVVCNVSDYSGACSNTATDFAKLVTITVFTPQQNEIVFAGFKANF